MEDAGRCVLETLASLSGLMLECEAGGVRLRMVAGNPSGCPGLSLMLSEVWDSIVVSRRRPFPSQITVGGGRPAGKEKKLKKIAGIIIFLFCSFYATSSPFMPLSIFSFPTPFPHCPETFPYYLPSPTRKRRKQSKAKGSIARILATNPRA